jgi:putative transposase
MVLKAYKFRLYPTGDQIRYMDQIFGSVRFVYKWGLDARSGNWDMIETMRYSWGGDLKTCDMEMVAQMRFWGLKDKSKEGYPKACGLKELSSELTHTVQKEKPWLTEVPNKPLRYALRNLDAAYKNFFRRVKNGETPGYPAFKSRKGNQSFQFQGENVRLDEVTGLVTLHKALGPMDVRLHRRIDGTIKTTTVSKTKSGKYYISFQVEDGRELPLPKPIRNTIGLDVGLNTFVTTSGGEKIDGISPFRESEKRLAVLQRRASRKQKGSQNWKKAMRKVALCHEKIANQRRDFQHKLSRRLVDENDLIAVEDLNVRGMVKNHHLAKSISDAAWSEFSRQLEYKATWAGKTFVKIDRWEPTSKQCSSCGFKNGDMPLSVREWDCPQCGVHHDRDINAAVNIREAGINRLHTNAI